MSILMLFFEVTNRQWEAQTQDNDEFLATQGRTMEILSEHQCEGWLEGYLLTGRHGLFTSYEAFIHIIDSMFNQHAKWLKVSAKLLWRKKTASLNYLLASHVWQQAHNGDTHQDPGFIDHVVNKKASIARVYLPPDSNSLLSVADHCLRSRNYVNVVIAGKYLAPQWLKMEEAIEHCTRRTNHANMHVRGYKEEGTITTFFDNLVLNDLDRFHLVIDVINRLPQLSDKAAKLKLMLEEKLIEHRKYINKNGEDLPEIRNWKWNQAKS